MIESILMDHLQNGSTSSKKGNEERRRHERRPTMVPAHVEVAGGQGKAKHGAVVRDLSLGGMSLTVSKECLPEIHKVGKCASKRLLFCLMMKYRFV